MSSFFAGCLPYDETPACTSSWFGALLGGSQQTGVTARAGSGTHRAPGSEEDSLNPGSEEEERPQACPSPMSLSTPRGVSGTSGMQTVLANYSSYLFDTDSMDWIAAAEATRNTGYGERKKKRAFVADRYKSGGVAFPGASEAENSK